MRSFLYLRCRPTHGGWQVLSLAFTPPTTQTSPLYIRLLTTNGRTRGLRFTLPILGDAERLAYSKMGIQLQHVQWPIPTQQAYRPIQVHAVVHFPIRGVSEHLHVSLERALAGRTIKDVILVSDCQVSCSNFACFSSRRIIQIAISLRQDFPRK